MSNRITPFVKRMRANGGTIYTFSSALEDIGLNINERNNLVKISNFALLNIPNIAESSTGYLNNTFNIRNIVGAWEYEQDNLSIKDGRVLIAESFQNYALNFEANLLNQNTYNPELSATVSERVFWKWLKETGAIRWADPSTRGTQTRYWTEEIDSNDYSSVVKYVGQVSAGNVRIDTFGTYNETYILVPTSHGQTSAFFKQVEDDNYKHGISIHPDNPNENILGRGTYTRPHPDALSYRAYYDFVDGDSSVGSYEMFYDDNNSGYIPGWWYTAEGIVPTSIDNVYLTDSDSYLNTGNYSVKLKYDNGSNQIEFKRSKVDCVQLEFDLEQLKTIYNDPALTYDKMAIDNFIDDSFDFNAALIYYTVYNSTQDEILATNLLGIMFLDAPSGSSADIVTSGKGIQLPSLEKIMSGPSGFGTSYSLRLNIKTDNMLDDTTATVIDESTSDQLWGEEWQQAFANLNIAVNTLTQQNATFNYISGQYVTLQENQTQILNRLINLEYQVNDISRDIQGVENTIPIFSDGEDPLIESSIYMRHGKIGMFNNNPQYGVHIDSDVKSLDLIIENAIRDTSGNVILGYGSPLRLGSSTNYRDVEIYSGNVLPNIIIDSSDIIILRGDVSIKNNLSVDGSTIFKENVYFEASIYSPGLDSKYLTIPKGSATGNWVGAGLNWDDDGFLNVEPNSDVSAAGTKGDIQFASNTASLSADSSLYWDDENARLGIKTREPSADIHVVNDIRYDGKLYNGETEIKPGAQINSPDNNKIITSDGTTLGLNTESNLSFNGATLDLTGNFTLSGTIDNIGDTTTIKSKIKLPDITESSQAKMLYYNESTGEVTYNTASSGGIEWSATNTSYNNRVGTYLNATQIAPEANLTFDGTTLTVTNHGNSSNWKTAYDHSQNNSQAHNDYLKNNDNDTTTGTITAAGFKKSGGTSSQFLKANGSIDSNSYITSITAGTNLTGTTTSGVVTLDVDENSSFSSVVTPVIKASTSSGISFKENNNATKFLMTDGGNFHAAGNIIGNSSSISDIRLKRDIKKLENSLEKIKQLNGISYKRKNKDEIHFGLIAQETEKIIPELILNTLILGEDENTNYKTIRYQEIIPHLIEAIKEQQSQIDILKEEINNLKK